MDNSPILRLESFGVAFGERVILAEINAELPRTGMTVLVGPAGSGKSTLLRTVAGLNDSHPSLSVWGKAFLDGAELCTKTRKAMKAGEVRSGIGFVMQNMHFFLDSVRENLVSGLPNRSQMDLQTQKSFVQYLLISNGMPEIVPQMEQDVASLPTALQRKLAAVCAVLSNPILLMADETTAALSDEDAEAVLEVLRVQSKLRSVLFVTHNRAHAQAAGGTTILLAGGRIQEMAPTDEFFRTPRTEHGERYVRTGGCLVANPNSQPDELDDSVEAPKLPEAATARSQYEGPRGFFWIWPGRLGGLPRPGIVNSMEHDVEGLKRMGVTVLVGLEETFTVDLGLLGRFGISPLHFPVVDMSVPGCAEAADLCQRIKQIFERGGVVAMHCRAGLGRTGTMLACQLICAGETARAAIEIVRRINPQCIQSNAQVEFLSSFESFCPTRSGLREGAKEASMA